MTLPKDFKLRKAILGENNALLDTVTVNTGASVQLEPRNDLPDYDKPVWISGKDDCVARALQMLANAVKTHAPFWRFPLPVEGVVDALNETAKSAEIARLAASDEAHQDRWTVPHTVFVPEQALAIIRVAIKLGTFTMDCAALKIDPVMTGKITLDAPSVNQSDSALIKLCDIVREIDPGWMPDNEAARQVIHNADKHAGPSVTSKQPMQPEIGHFEQNGQDTMFQAAQKNWQASPKSTRRGFPHGRQGSRHSSVMFTGEAQRASPRIFMQV